MIPLLLIVIVASTAETTPLDAERAFAADAQSIGQWSAFRKWAAQDATMFVPQPINAQSFLKDRKDPAKAVDWWPTASYVSCDGRLAINTGGWRRPDGSIGYFTTVWRQQNGRWKWIVDGGDGLNVARPRPARPVITRASCTNAATVAQSTLVKPGAKRGDGASPDGTISWNWQVTPDGARSFTARMKDGSPVAKVIISDEIAAAPR